MTSGSDSIAVSSLGHAERMHLREGSSERVKDFVRNLALFGANRIIGQLPGHAFRLAYYRNILGWKIGAGSNIHHGLKIYGGRGRVSIGRNSTIQMDCLLVGAGLADLQIGDNVAIAYRACLILGSHDIQANDFVALNAPITIEDYVFIASQAMILQGVTLGEGCVVTAGSVVTKSVPPYSIVRGNPAQVVGKRRQGLTYSAHHAWDFH